MKTIKQVFSFFESRDYDNAYELHLTQNFRHINIDDIIKVYDNLYFVYDTITPTMLIVKPL
jgi:hypothetical protein